MLASERRSRILADLDRRGSVRVSELVAVLGVSDMTVRRDLDALQREGELDKVHGGATRRATRSTDEPGFDAKSSRKRAQKEAIGAAAAALVEPGSAMAISAGTTTHAMAQHLSALDVTVVTNSVWVADVLHTASHTAGRTDLTVLLTGGLRTPSDALVGPIAINALRSLHVDMAFLGVHGMDAVTGFTTPNLMESETNRALAACARRVVVVADSSKWGVLGLSSFAALSEADMLVSDTGLGREARSVLTEQVGELLLVEPAAGVAGGTG